MGLASTAKEIAKGKLGWLRPAGASMEELEQQLARANETLEEAREATARAQSLFDSFGDPHALEQLNKARAAEAVAREHVERARRLVGEAEQALAAHDRTELIAARAELDRELAQSALRLVREPLVAKEAALILELANVRAQRRELERELLRKRMERERIGAALGEPEPYRTSEWSSIEPAWPPVEEQVERLLRELPQNDDRRIYASEVVFGLSYALAIRKARARL